MAFIDLQRIAAESAEGKAATGKVQAILVSGDNMRHEYNEPEAMQRWLVEQGVPADKVVLDHAGFDTYDSCARAKRIFGVERATVVTQQFHLARAVTVCRHLGIDANGVGIAVRHGPAPGRMIVLLHATRGSQCRRRHGDTSP